MGTELFVVARGSMSVIIDSCPLDTAVPGVPGVIRVDRGSTIVCMESRPIETAVPGIGGIGA